MLADDRAFPDIMDCREQSDHYLNSPRWQELRSRFWNEVTSFHTVTESFKYLRIHKERHMQFTLVHLFLF